MVAWGAKALAAVLLVALVLPGAFDGRASPVSPSAASAGVLRRAHNASEVGLVIPGGATRWSRKGVCPMAVNPAAYVNPLVGATVKPERIDQGVDYAGSGTLGAIGQARIAYVATANAGWPGAFIEYELLAGPDAGCYVYYAEGVTPEPGLTVGERVTAGQRVATIIPDYPTGIELGWAAGTGTKTYAGLTSQWTTRDDEDDIASEPGKRFSRLISSLGGPPGKVEG
jgi:hypothetical protein